MKKQHPSELLYENEVRNFPHAMHLYVEQSRYEQELAEQHGEADSCTDHYIREAEDEAKRALEIYDRHQEAAAQAAVREKQAAVAEMRASGLTHIADAYEHEHYSELSI